MKIAIKKCNEEFKIIDIPVREGLIETDSDIYDAVQKEIDGYIQPIHLGKPYGNENILWVDEDGKLKNLPINFYMHTNIGIQQIVGTVCMTHTDKLVDGHLVYKDITQKDIDSFIKTIFY